MKMNFKTFGSFVLGALALMIVGPISHDAYAAEQQAKSSPPFSWGGVYAGLHVGYGWGDAETDVTPLPTAAIFVNLAPQTQDPNPNGVVGGLQAGFNWQKGILVLGVETDFSGSGMSGTERISPIIQNNGTPFPGAGFIKVDQDTDWFGTLRLRAGATPIPKLLLYGTGGLAYGRVNYSANTNFLPVGTKQYPVSFSKTKAGWTAGAGAEFALTNRWSVKAEYLYYDLGSESKTADPVLPFPPGFPPFQVRYKWETAAHILNIGLNFKF